MLFRAIALTLALLIGIGTIIPFGTDFAEASSRTSKKYKKHKKYKKYSKRWWRQYRARMKRKRALQARRRAMRLRQLRPRTSAQGTQSPGETGRCCKGSEAGRY
jgi:aminoglycoside N3'-acetyltransferase